MREPAGAVRRAVGCLLLLVMMVTAAFGELAAAAHPAVVMIGGIPVVVCGEGAPGGDPSSPAHQPAGPACCDHCVLGAPMLPPAPPTFARPRLVRYVAALEVRIGWTPTLARVRTPRQSQAPPARA